MEVLNFLESTAVATWVRESLSLWAFPTMIALHAIGMAVLVGLNVAICLLLLSSKPRAPMDSAQTFFRFIWLALAVNVVSGTLLLMANASELLVLPIFYIKILFVILSVIVLLKLQRGVATEVNYADADLSQKRLRILSVMCLATWMIALVAGRLTAYPMLLFGH
jgi:hypothetical protein